MEHGLNTNPVFKWRRALHAGEYDPVALLPVKIDAALTEVAPTASIPAWSCPCNSGHADTVRLMAPQRACTRRSGERARFARRSQLSRTQGGPALLRASCIEPSAASQTCPRGSRGPRLRVKQQHNQRVVVFKRPRSADSGGEQSRVDEYGEIFRARLHIVYLTDPAQDQHDIDSLCEARKSARAQERQGSGKFLQPVLLLRSPRQCFVDLLRATSTHRAATGMRAHAPTANLRARRHIALVVAQPLPLFAGQQFIDALVFIQRDPTHLLAKVAHSGVTGIDGCLIVR